MKKLTILLPLFLGGLFFAQSKADSIEFKKISDEILTNGQAYNNLHQLAKDIGHRLSGSEAYEKATKWAYDKLKEAGADKIWYQDVMIPVWERGKESLQIKTKSGSYKSLNMLSIGNTEGTGGKDLEGEIIYVKSLEDLDKKNEADVKGKIVFFNYPFNQTFISTGQAYGDAGKYRFTAASHVAAKGGKAMIIRSLSSAFDDVPHTGAQRYDEKYPKIPAVCIGVKSADELEKTLKSRPIFACVTSSH